MTRIWMTWTTLWTSSTLYEDRFSWLQLACRLRRKTKTVGPSFLVEIVLKVEDQNWRTQLLKGVEIHLIVWPGKTLSVKKWGQSLGFQLHISLFHRDVPIGNWGDIWRGWHSGPDLLTNYKSHYRNENDQSEIGRQFCGIWHISPICHSLQFDSNHVPTHVYFLPGELVVCVTKLWEIHQCCGWKETVKHFGAATVIKPNSW